MPSGEEITGCPMKLVTAEAREMLEACDFAEDGNLPEDGGTNSQTLSFLDALRHYRNDNASWKAKLTPNG